MESTLSPEQKKQIDSWVGQRDSILKEVAIVKGEHEALLILNKNLSESNTEIANKIQQSVGRLEELDKREKEYEEILSLDVSALSVTKTRLETEVTNLQNLVKSLLSDKEVVVKDISFLKDIHGAVFDKTAVLEKVIEHVTRVSSTNIRDVEGFVVALKSKIDEILILSTTNIQAHNLILSEIPKLFVELHRKSLEREIISNKKTHE